MRKGVGLEMDKSLFLELFVLMQGYASDPANPLRVIAGDFVARNQEKFDKHKARHDEAIQFMPREAVVRVEGDSEGYLVLRARLKPDGKREYWLTDIRNLHRFHNVRKNLPIEYKVSAKHLSHVSPLSSNYANLLNSFTKLPKKV